LIDLGRALAAVDRAADGDHLFQQAQFLAST
jgi:hypothetical protein